LRQAIATGVLRNAIWHFCIINISTPLVLKSKGKEKDLLIPIAPSSKPGVYGGIYDDKHIKPATVCSYWYPSPYIAGKDRNKKVVLHFHGGAFVVGDSGYAAGLLTKNIGKPLMVFYRLSPNPGWRFPTALPMLSRLFVIFLI
jgi:acetyl esterase/lipase